MTRRERLERKLEKRREWAAGRRAKAAAKFDTAHAATEGIPFGQPILVGHHSEKRHRAALDKQDRNMRAGCESIDMAEHHESKADGLESQLDTSVFSDDEDAVEQLEARVAEREAQRERMKQINKEIRKGDGWEARLQPPLTDDEKKELVSNARFANCVGYPSYSLTNLGANIRRDKERIEHIKKRRARAEQAEAAGGVLITVNGEWAAVTFAEKPEREILTALKAADFHWGAGYWSGRADKLPECVKELQANNS